MRKKNLAFLQKSTKKQKKQPERGKQKAQKRKAQKKHKKSSMKEEHRVWCLCSFLSLFMKCVGQVKWMEWSKPTCSGLNEQCCVTFVVCTRCGTRIAEYAWQADDCLRFFAGFANGKARDSQSIPAQKTKVSRISVLHEAPTRLERVNSEVCIDVRIDVPSKSFLDTIDLARRKSQHETSRLVRNGAMGSRLLHPFYNVEDDEKNHGKNLHDTLIMQAGVCPDKTQRSCAYLVLTSTSCAKLRDFLFGGSLLNDRTGMKELKYMPAGVLRRFASRCRSALALTACKKCWPFWGLASLRATITTMLWCMVSLTVLSDDDLVMDEVDWGKKTSNQKKKKFVFVF